MNENTLKSQAFKLKGRLYTLTVLTILSTDEAELRLQLEGVVANAPKLFANTPVVIDFTELTAKSIDLETIANTIKSFGLVPVAIQSNDITLNNQAQLLSLALLRSSSKHDKPIITDITETKNKPLPKNKMITTPVRSGQQIVSSGDLIVCASVGHGAELLADGNIHIYGRLRGRALAGIDGNKGARIFCSALDAELVSIAGFYRLSDAISNVDGPCQIYLKDDHIQIESLC